MTTPSAALQHF